MGTILTEQINKQIDQYQGSTACMVLETEKLGHSCIAGIASGFFLKYEEFTFWVTASHVRHETIQPAIRENLTSVYFLLRVNDNWQKLPFDVARSSCVDIQDLVKEPLANREETKSDFDVPYDFCVYPISGLPLAHLNALSIKVMEYSEDLLQTMQEQAHPSSAVFVLHGYPNSGHSHDVVGHVVGATLKTLQVTFSRETDGQRYEFLPAWLPGEHEGSLKGFSGSPILFVNGESLIPIGTQVSAERYGKRLYVVPLERWMSRIAEFLRAVANSEQSNCS